MIKLSCTSRIQNVLGVFAIADLTLFIIVVLGGNSCGRGDGCFVYSILFVGAALGAVMVLSASAVVWKTSGNGTVHSTFFKVSILALLATSLIMISAVVIRIIA